MESTDRNAVSPALRSRATLPVGDIGKYRSHAISILAQTAYSSHRIPLQPGERRCQIRHSKVAPARPATSNKLNVLRQERKSVPILEGRFSQLLRILNSVCRTCGDASGHGAVHPQILDDLALVIRDVPHGDQRTGASRVLSPVR